MKKCFYRFLICGVLVLGSFDGRASSIPEDEFDDDYYVIKVGAPVMLSAVGGGVSYLADTVLQKLGVKHPWVRMGVYGVGFVGGAAFGKWFGDACWENELEERAKKSDTQKSKH